MRGARCEVKRDMRERDGVLVAGLIVRRYHTGLDSGSDANADTCALPRTEAHGSHGKARDAG